MASASSLARVLLNGRGVIRTSSSLAGSRVCFFQTLGQQTRHLQGSQQQKGAPCHYHRASPLANHNRDFSTAAVVQTTESSEKEPASKKAKSKRRRTLQTKDPIIVTERAAARINELLSGDNAKGAIGIVLGVKRRGCNGLSYTLNYAFEEPKDNGASMTAHGIKVFIEPMALFNVVGTTMDWEEDEMTSEFTFNNPNSKGECGCGESFNV